MHFAFNSFSAFLTMGRNGIYVWTAYSIVFFTLLFQLWKRRE